MATPPKLQRHLSATFDLSHVLVARLNGAFPAPGMHGLGKAGIEDRLPSITVYLRSGGPPTRLILTHPGPPSTSLDDQAFAVSTFFNHQLTISPAGVRAGRWWFRKAAIRCVEFTPSPVPPGGSRPSTVHVEMAAGIAWEPFDVFDPNDHGYMGPKGFADLS